MTQNVMYEEHDTPPSQYGGPDLILVSETGCSSNRFSGSIYQLQTLGQTAFPHIMTTHPPAMWHIDPYITFGLDS